MSFLKRRLSWGSGLSGWSGRSARSGSSASSVPPVPDSEMRLTLDGTTLALGRDGQWHLDSSTVGDFEKEIGRLQAYAAQLESEKKLVRTRARASA
jgi:hypothetical protein